jgi:hypothetical protein
MFDEILVPKSYLRGLLKKRDERFFNKDHLFQTKDLDNVMDLYKIHRQRLYKLDRSVQHIGEDEKWNIVKDSIEINFHDIVKSKNGDEHSVEFEFSFKNGRVDQKKLVSLALSKTKKEIDSVAKMWDTEQEILNAYRNSSLKYRFFSFLQACLQKLTNWAREGHTIPIEIRRDAYEKSGRLEFDPECLNIYKDQ